MLFMLSRQVNDIIVLRVADEAGAGETNWWDACGHTLYLSFFLCSLIL